MADRDTDAGRRLRWHRMLLLLLAYAAILAVGHWGGTWLGERFLPEPGSALRAKLQILLALSFATYILLLAMPFVPGIEISLAIMAALGKSAALPIYLATIVALTISYLIGRVVPLRALAAVFGFLGFDNARSDLTAVPRLLQGLLEMANQIPCRVRHAPLETVAELPRRGP